MSELQRNNIISIDNVVIVLLPAAFHCLSERILIIFYCPPCFYKSFLNVVIKKIPAYLLAGTLFCLLH